MNTKLNRSEFLLFCLLVISICVFSAHGQSGRRQPKQAPAAPVPTPTPEPSPKPKNDQKETDLGFLIGADRYSSYESFPFSYYDAAMRGCGDRLRSGSSAKVDLADSSMNRGEAIKKAKAETTTYVVELKLILDNTARSYDDLELEFVVFAPQTAKVVVFGKSYLNANRKGPIVLNPRGTTSALYREELLKRAGEDAAERILKALNLNVPVMKAR